MATRTSRLIVALTDHATGPAGKVERSLDRLDRRSGMFGAGLRNGTRLTGRMATAMGAYAASTAAAAAPLAAGFGLVDTIRTAADFETRLTEIAKKGDLSAEALAKVKDEILGIVESGEIAMGPAEIAAAYERGIAAGIPLDKMREFTMLSAKAADAWGMTGEEVGNAFAGFNTTMNISFEQMERFADLINTLADAGISDERDIVAFLDRAGATLQTFGMSREAIAAYGATLLNLKMPSEVAARAMNTLSTKLLTPKATKASTKAFTELYGSADMFVAMLEDDANGALKDFLFRLRDLDKFRRAEILTGILGQGFTDEINRLVEALPELEKNLKLSVSPELYVGSLDAGYQQKLDTMEAKWKIFKANLDKLQIDLGNLILPPAGGFLQDATRAANDLSDAIDAIKTTWQTLRDAITGQAETPGDFDPKGFDPLDPWGVTKRTKADRYRREQMRQMAGDKDTKDDPALGAFGARSMEGVTAGRLLAGTRNEVRRTVSDTPREQKRQQYRAALIHSHREAEAESMEALRDQFGAYLMPDGQSFRPGTDARDLVDEALAKFAGVVLTATAVIEQATGQKVTPDAVTQAAGIPVPTPRPIWPIPIPTPRPERQGGAATPRPDEPQKVKFDGTPTVRTEPSGVQRVQVTNPMPTPNITVTVHAQTNADPHAIAGEVERVLSHELNALSRGAFSDGAA